MTPTSSPVIAHAELTAEQLAKASGFLSETRDALAATVTGLSLSQWDFKPDPARWSIAEILEHIVLIENRVHAIIGKMSDAPCPEPGWEPLEMDARILVEVPKRTLTFAAPPPVCPANRWSGAEALAHFLEGRKTTESLVSAPALRGHVVPHPFFGPWDGYQWLLACAGHGARHTEQIREVKAHPDFPQT